MIMHLKLSTGTLHLASGDRYTGDWKDGKRHGHGTYFYRCFAFI
jgi:hypothetical protein